MTSHLNMHRHFASKLCSTTILSACRAAAVICKRPALSPHSDLPYQHGEDAEILANCWLPIIAACLAFCGRYTAVHALPTSQPVHITLAGCHRLSSIGKAGATLATAKGGVAYQAG